MARGKVTVWNGQTGRIRDDADGASCIFGDRSLRGLQPGDVSAGLDVEFDRAQDAQGPVARNVRRPGGGGAAPPAAAAPTGRVEGWRGPRMGGGRPPRRGPDTPAGRADAALLAEVPVPARLRELLAK